MRIGPEGGRLQPGRRSKIHRAAAQFVASRCASDRVLPATPPIVPRPRQGLNLAISDVRCWVRLAAFYIDKSAAGLERLFGGAGADLKAERFHGGFIVLQPSETARSPRIPWDFDYLKAHARRGPASRKTTPA